MESATIKAMKNKKKTPSDIATNNTRPQTWGEKAAKAGIVLVILTAVYQIAKHLHLLSFNAATDGVIGIGTIFLLGLTASISSCLAMVGGLLLSVSASWDKNHPNATRWEKMEPQIYFNIGRVIGYFVLGGLTGLLGRELILSVSASGILKIAISIIMIWLGLNILELLPKKFCSMPLPAFAVRHLRHLSHSESILGPFFLGSLTYFIPCGFTQSMQLLALASESFNQGAMIMTIFALGTLPALLGIGALSAFAQGKAGRIFMMIAGSASLLLGLGGLQAGLNLAGIHITMPALFSSVNDTDPNVTIDGNGQQIISVSISDKGYNVDSFIIEANKTTWIYATAEALSGCLNSMIIPAFNVNQVMNKGENWVGPIRPTKDFAFMCSAGIYRANVTVKS